MRTFKTQHKNEEIMKEIKFRVFIKWLKITLEVESIDFIKKRVYCKTELGKQNPCDFYNFDDVVIMQYTGLKDKNGVEIYEGDIVNFQHIDDYGYMTNVFQNGFYRGVVKWGGHYPAFDIFDIKDNSTFGFDCNIFSMESDIVIEVIGKIYENPELLEN